jgi:cytoskeletal protein CcmA (bactofilin family)
VEITDCDTLVVEGTVEATMNSRVIQIAEQGAFRGSAEIDIAEIHGEFNGNLTVRQKLVIFSTGKVSGSIRYGKIVIEEGGQLSGDIQVGAGGTASSSSSAFSSSSASGTSGSTWPTRPRLRPPRWPCKPAAPSCGAGGRSLRKAGIFLPQCCRPACRRLRRHRCLSCR